MTKVTFAYAGTVKDFEGDGALIYFASVKNAVRAALAIQRTLADGRCDVACGDGPGIRARMSVTVGDVVVGTVGCSTRQGVALVGPSVNIGARLLKHAPLGTIIASDAVLADLQEAPRLADEFHPLDAAFAVPGGDGMTIATYIVPCSCFSRRISRTCLIRSLSVMSVGSLLHEGTLPGTAGYRRAIRVGGE